MTREVSEWIGATPDTRIPPRVRIRQYIRDNGTCQCGCTIRIMVGDKWQTDHKVALVNGGENRESNLRTLLVKHHAAKTAEDVAEKSRVYRKRAKYLGIRPARQKIASRGFQKAPPQRTASRPIQR